MKAVICERYGSPEVLRMVDREKPSPKDNEILVKVRATTVTAADHRVRAFDVPISFWLPAKLVMGFGKPRVGILGSEMAGEVVETGRNVTRFKVGDRVFANTGTAFGCYTEYKSFPENGNVVKMPANSSYEMAAAITFGGITALHFIKQAGIKNGTRVLVYGASGCVGSSAVQLARHFGATVTGVCSTANIGLVKSIGAERVIDYTKEDFSTLGETWDVVIEAVGKSSLTSCVRALKNNGILLHAVAPPTVDIFLRIASLFGSKIFIGGHMKITTEDMAFLGKLVETGELKPVIDRRYPFEQIVEAHRYVDMGHKKGNVVITVNDGN